MAGCYSWAIMLQSQNLSADRPPPPLFPIHFLELDDNTFLCYIK